SRACTPRGMTTALVRVSSIHDFQTVFAASTRTRSISARFLRPRETMKPISNLAPRRESFLAGSCSRSTRSFGTRAGRVSVIPTRRLSEFGRSQGSEKVTRRDGDRTGRVVWDRREDGQEAGADLNLRSIGVADLDQASVAPAVVTLDVAAAVDRARIGAGCDGRADHRAGGNADTKTDTKTGMGLGVTACCNETADEREGRERGTGEFRLGQHGSLHPFESGATDLAAYPLVVGGEEQVQSFEKPCKITSLGAGRSIRAGS